MYILKRSFSFFSKFFIAGLAIASLSACVTAEGTNALVDFTTFEREVATETLKGLGMLERENKEVIKTPRAPLALPNDTNVLPTPKAANEELLPKDSDKVQIDASGLTEADIKQLRNARVVDLRTLGGRPLTEVESRKLIARMKAARISMSQKIERPLYLPSDEYFVTVGGVELICLAENGDLVSLKDPRCPPAIRDALLKN